MDRIEDGQASPVTSALSWDTNTAAAALVLGSLMFLILVRRGFRGVVVNLGA